MLLDVGAEEIIIAFDRQFQNIGDEEFKHLKNKHSEEIIKLSEELLNEYEK